jgi:ATP-dependent exoDNAse (exonuclease V) beta subunit
MTLIDAAARAVATDPSASFIVQAPAGSGKTEILTQRYLRLLSTVTAPEQIIALTFTRKAANEMRERIIIALQNGRNKTEAKTPHQQTTLNYAQQALKQDERYEWNILQHPNRLKIITIDSLCQNINQAIPLLEQQISYAQITDSAHEYYLKAARECIQFALETPHYQNDIKLLLLHVDNRQAYLVELLTNLLAQRDQWLSLLFQARSQDKASFEEALSFIEAHELARFKTNLPSILAAELVRLARELACVENNPHSPRYTLTTWTDFKQSTQATAQALCHVLLGSDQQYRKAFDHHVGLSRDSCPAAQYKRLKEESQALLSELTQYPEFLHSLMQVSKLPKPKYDAEQWDLLQALFNLLPLLASHLHLLFCEHNEVDFTAIAQQALIALGTAEEPTETALYLDHAIHHLLVDEFQDTSITQFALLTQLVQGWQQDDGKTLFIVGDPMQSIYRFRQAEVGLFYRAQTQGIGPIELKSLALQCNFRSTPTIVDWVNEHFSSLFPAHFDIESGAVSFHSSVAIRDQDAESSIVATAFDNPELEAKHLVEQIQYELNTRPEQSIAVLVRSRTQLPVLINLLRNQQIPYQGTDIDLLAHFIHLRDVWSITQALLMPGNRLTWLSALRSPYCGLELSDLHRLAQYKPRQSIYRALLALDSIEGISHEGKIRAQFFIKVMHHALASRGQTKVSDWVRATLEALNQKAILNQDEYADLEQFWTLLDRYDQQGRIIYLNEFEEELKTLYSQQSTKALVQIMTIHKSKGLEFDTVFLPYLGAQPRNAEAPLLRWLKIPTKHQEPLLLVSPIKAAHHEQCQLYDYISDLDKEKSYYESQRVLYVAATRARSRLYLSDGSKKTSSASFRGMLKKQHFTDSEQERLVDEQEHARPKLSRLPLEFFTGEYQGPTPLINPLPALTSNIHRQIGVITHRILQLSCEHHFLEYSQIPWIFVETEVCKLGYDEETHLLALSIIQKQLRQLFDDPTGKWLIAPHEQEHNEYALLVKQQEQVRTKIIDRCFVEDQKLWVIDFKTGSDELEAHTKHQTQLNEYAYFLSENTALPIHCGIYYLMNNRWEHWEYQLLAAESMQ